MGKMWTSTHRLVQTITLDAMSRFWVVAAQSQFHSHPPINFAPSHTLFRCPPTPRSPYPIAAKRLRDERLEAAEALNHRVHKGARLRHQLRRKHLVEVGENDDGGGRVLVAVEPNHVLERGAGRGDGQEEREEKAVNQGVPEINS